MLASKKAVGLGVGIAAGLWAADKFVIRYTDKDPNGFVPYMPGKLGMDDFALFVTVFLSAWAGMALSAKL